MTSEEKLNLDLVIRLAVIIGHCNVLYEMMAEGSQQIRRLAQIRSMVALAMKDLTEHQQKHLAPAIESQSRPIENHQRKTEITPAPVERPVH
jgi:hypothetical protein